MHHKLNDKEQRVLRLLSQGYDIKSAARRLNVTEGNVTERLREVRRKLGVSSSREAARLFAEFERQHPRFSGNSDSGIADTRFNGPQSFPPESRVETGAEIMPEITVERQIGHLPFHGFTAGFRRLPLRGRGETGNALGLWERIAAIVDISTKLAALFALTCLIAISVNLLMQ